MPDDPDPSGRRPGAAPADDPDLALATGLAFLFGRVLIQFVDQRQLLDGNRHRTTVIDVGVRG